MSIKRPAIQAVLVTAGLLVLIYVSKLLRIQSELDFTIPSQYPTEPLHIALSIVGAALLTTGVVGFVISGNRKKRLIIVGLSLVFIVLAHLVPVYSRVGFYVNPKSEVCSGVGLIFMPSEYNYRLIPDGISGFYDTRTHFSATEDPGTCSDAIVLKLYLL